MHGKRSAHARAWLLAGATAAGLTLTGAPTLAAEDLGNERNPTQLLRDIGNSGASLLDAIRAVGRNETATVAKFERDDRGNIVLSVYTSGRGLDRDAEHNVFKEYKGRVVNGDWRPRGETLDDFEHVARAAEYHVLMSISPYSLEDIAEKANREGDKLLWVQPRVIDNHAVFEAGLAQGDRIVNIHYDLLGGNLLDRDDRDRGDDRAYQRNQRDRFSR